MKVGFLIASVEQGFVYAVMALGVYLTFRILDFPDLTVDGSFPLGAAIAAKMIVNGSSPLISTFMPLIFGALAGIITGLLHTKGKITGLLAGILTMIALYSINLRIMDKPNIPLLREETIITMVSGLGLPKWLPSLALFVVFALIIKLFLDWFLFTEIGLAIRATGDNPHMIRSLGANTDNMKILGLAISNALVAFSGGLVAQYQGFADVGMGIGMIIAGLAAVIIGEVVFGAGGIKRATIAVVGGSILYRLAIAAALLSGLRPSDLKLITALLVVFALSTPRVKALLSQNKTAVDG
ncbi:MAG: ABC transporter permease [Clostridia bacterium]|nr:ABC transporter permease [Clostridia bacterium]